MLKDEFGWLRHGNEVIDWLNATTAFYPPPAATVKRMFASEWTSDWVG